MITMLGGEVKWGRYDANASFCAMWSIKWKHPSLQGSGYETHLRIAARFMLT